MNIFGIGLPEMAVIAAIGLLVFGPKRLPELGKTLGRTLRGFQSASQEFEQEFRSAIAVGEAATAPTEASALAAGSAVDTRAFADPAVATAVAANPVNTNLASASATISPAALEAVLATADAEAGLASSATAPLATAPVGGPEVAPAAELSAQPVETVA